MKTKATKHVQRELLPGHSQSTALADERGKIRRLAQRIAGMRRKAATVALIALTASLAFYAVFGRDGLVAYQNKQRQAAQLRHQILEMQKENQRMSLHDQRLKNDRDTIEYEAREQMHYTRPGEVIYTLPKAPKAASHQ